MGRTHPHQFHSHTPTLLQIADHQAMIQDDMPNWGREGLTPNVNDRPLSRWQARAGFERHLDLRQTMHKPINKGDHKPRRPITERAKHQRGGHEQPSCEHMNFSLMVTSSPDKAQRATCERGV
jgi:hypothetical protein